MKTKDLIKQLQDMVDAHEEHIPVMGEHEIMIDVWELVDLVAHRFEYKGFSPNIQITHTSDGVYPILAAKESW